MEKSNISKESIIYYLNSIKKDFVKKGIEKIALFGSFSNGNQSIYSDIDIAIKKDKDFLKKFSPYDYFEIVSELKDIIKKRFGKNVDIFDLDSNSPFLNSIKKELLYV